jgi:hypothetical protein
MAIPSGFYQTTQGLEMSPSMPASSVSDITPKPSKDSPNPWDTEFHEEKEVNQIKAAINKCLLSLAPILTSAPKPLLAHYLTGMSNSKKIFIAFIHAREDFSEALRDNLSDQLVSRLFTRMITARDALKQEFLEMTARFNQEPTKDHKVEFRIHEFTEERSRRTQMIETDRQTPIFRQALGELIADLSNIQWITDKDRRLYDAYGISF